MNTILLIIRYDWWGALFIRFWLEAVFLRLCHSWKGIGQVLFLLFACLHQVDGKVALSGLMAQVITSPILFMPISPDYHHFLTTVFNSSTHTHFLLYHFSLSLPSTLFHNLSSLTHSILLVFDSLLTVVIRILFFIIVSGYVFTIIVAFILYDFRIMSGGVNFLILISEGVRVAFQLLNHIVLTWYGTTPTLYPSTFPPFMTTASLTTLISPSTHYSPQVIPPSFNASA